MMTDSDESLVRSARSGDRSAFEELVRRTSRLVFVRLYLETGDAHRAEDLLQETLLTAYRSLGQLTEPKAFRTWLLKIAQNAFTEPFVASSGKSVPALRRARPPWPRSRTGRRPPTSSSPAGRSKRRSWPSCAPSPRNTACR
jgi:hypothetical protein